MVDFFSLAAMKVAKELKIPLVINHPGSCDIFEHLDLPMLSKCSSWLGLTVFFNTPSFRIKKRIRPLYSTGPYYSSSLVLMNTFFGYDTAQSLPPNVRLVGPSFELSPPKKLESELEEWLTTIRKDGKKVIYITFGSLVSLAQPFIEHLYYGLKRTDLAVIWSLRQGQLP